MAAGFGESNTPAVLGGQAGTHNYINSQQLGELAMTQPQFFPKLVMRYGRQEITNLLRWMPGFSKGSSGAEIIRHVEEDYIQGKIVVDSDAGGSAGAAVTLTVQTDNIGTVSQTIPYADAGNASLNQPRITPIKYNQVQFANGVYAVVTEVDEAAGTFVVVPLDEADSIPALANGAEISVQGSFAKERSSALESVSSRFIYYENYQGHMRADYSVSSRAAGEPIWVQVPDRDGNMTDQWYKKGISDTYHRLMNGVDLMFLDGKVVNNPVIAALTDFSTIQRTLGLIETVSTSGNVVNYTSGALLMEDFDDMFFAFSRNKAPKDYMGLAGMQFRKDANTLFRGGDGLDLWSDTNNAGRLVFNQFNGMKKQGLSLDIDYIKHLGYTIAFKQPDVFQDSQSLGIVDKYTKLCVMIPLGETVAYDYDNPASKVSVPTVRLVEKETNLGTTGYAEWMTGYAPKYNVATGSIPELNVHMTYSGALETFAINRFGIFLDGASA
jgi:hypothetical protein